MKKTLPSKKTFNTVKLIRVILTPLALICAVAVSYFIPIVFFGTDNTEAATSSISIIGKDLIDKQGDVEEEYNVKLVKPVDGSDGILDASDITWEIGEDDVVELQLIGLTFTTSTGVLSGKLAYNRQAEITIYAFSELQNEKTSKTITINVPKQQPNSISITGPAQITTLGPFSQYYNLTQTPEVGGELNIGAVSNIEWEILNGRPEWVRWSKVSDTQVIVHGMIEEPQNTSFTIEASNGILTATFVVQVNVSLNSPTSMAIVGETNFSESSYFEETYTCTQNPNPSSTVGSIGTVTWGISSDDFAKLTDIGVTFDKSNGKLSGTPLMGADATVTITAMSNTYPSLSASLIITIKVQGEAQSVSFTGNMDFPTTGENVNRTYTLTQTPAVGPDAESVSDITWQTTDLPDYLVFTPSTDKLTATLTSTSAIPAGADFQFQITVQAKTRSQTLDATTQMLRINTPAPAGSLGVITGINGRTIIVRNQGDMDDLCSVNNTLTVNNTTFNRNTVTSFKFGSGFTSNTLQNNFLRGIKITTNANYFTIPDSVTTIENYVFYNTTFLKPLKLSKNLETIGGSFLSESIYPWEIKIPSTVTRIRDYFLYTMAGSEMPTVDFGDTMAAIFNECLPERILSSNDSSMLSGPGITVHADTDKANLQSTLANRSQNPYRKLIWV